MRGLYTPITQIRREVFVSVAKAAYEDWDMNKMEEIPFEIIPGEVPQYRDSVYKERAIVTERVRLAMNQTIRPTNVINASLTYQFSQENLEKREFSEDQMWVIPAACDSCEEKSYFVSNSCHSCIAHSCMSICPTGAIGLQNGHTYIDQDVCIRCGKCYTACQYHAIIKNERPCIAACGAGAMGKDNLNRACIDHNKCVACGQCMVNCPFGAIADKSEIYQVIKRIKKEEMNVAIVAPAFVGQFGDSITVEQAFEAIRQLGFQEVYEVAYGADITTINEATHYINHVPNDQPYLCTSCCPGWVGLAQDVLKEQASYISHDYSPMVETAILIKEKYPNATVTFIGPCTAKKKEQQRENVKPFVDYVLTYEEVMAMFIAKDINLDEIVVEGNLNQASKDGRGFAIKSGVAKAVERTAHQMNPNKEVLMEAADGLQNCKTMALLAKAGKKNGYLLEGMACPGGCIGGAGTVINQTRAVGCVQTFANQSQIKNAIASVNREK